MLDVRNTFEGYTTIIPFDDCPLTSVSAPLVSHQDQMKGVPLTMVNVIVLEVIVMLIMCHIIILLFG